ncbi:MAG: tail fiber domain-containing protein [Phycisphaerales bacterium]
MSRTTALAAAALFIAATFVPGVAVARADQPSTAFAYQGKLLVAEGAITGQADLRFTLYPTAAGGSPIGQSFTAPSVPVDSGVFVTRLDFGTNVWTGSQRYIEIAVRSPAGSGQFVTLSPRQEITPVPMALAVPGVNFAAAAGEVLDQQQTGFMGGVSSASTWQSFTPSITGLLSRIELRQLGGDPATGTLELYTGQGAAGTLLSTRPVSLLAANQTTSVVIDPPVQVTAGQVYTFRTQFVNAPTFSLQLFDSYPGGISSAGSDTDLWFKTYVTTGTSLLKLNANNVGINTDAPNATLSVNGTASKPGGGAWSTFSDARLKQDIRPLDNALARLLRLHGVSFAYTDPAAIGELAGPRVGFVAQDVETVFPDWVSTAAGAGGYKMLTIRGFEALAVEALRDLRAEKDAQIESLRRENTELKAQLDRIEAALKSQK